MSPVRSSGIQEDSEAEMYAELLTSFMLPLPDDGLVDRPPPKKGKPPTIKVAQVPPAPGPAVQSPRIGSIDELIRSEPGRGPEKPSGGGALHKAKKHLKTLIGGARREKQAQLDDRDSDSESTLVSASRSTSTLNSTSDLDADVRLKDREARREERRRIIAERHALRSRANSISDESQSPTHPVLCRRFSRDVEHSQCNHTQCMVHGPNFHLTAIR